MKESNFKYHAIVLLTFLGIFFSLFYTWLVHNLGFTLMDAMHLSCAEAAAVDVFLSTDDKLVRLALRSLERLKVRVENPVSWLREVVQ